MKRFWLLFAALFGLWGCSTVDIDDYRAEKPVLELRDYFNGTLDAIVPVPALVRSDAPEMAPPMVRVLAPLRVN